MSIVSKLTEEIKSLESEADFLVDNLQCEYINDYIQIALVKQLRALRIQLELNRSEIGNIPDQLRHLRR